MDDPEIERAGARMGCDLLPVRAQGMLAVDLFNAEESGEPRAGHSPNGGPLPGGIGGELESCPSIDLA